MLCHMSHSDKEAPMGFNVGSKTNCSFPVIWYTRLIVNTHIMWKYMQIETCQYSGSTHSSPCCTTMWLIYSEDSSDLCVDGCCEIQICHSFIEAPFCVEWHRQNVQKRDSVFAFLKLAFYTTFYKDILMTHFQFTTVYTVK